MKNSFRLFALAALAAFAVSARAQITYTNSSVVNSLSLVGDQSPTFGQTFTNFTSISSMTWTLSNPDNSNSASGSYQASVYQWIGTATTGSALFTSAVTNVTVAASGNTGTDLAFDTSSMASLNPNLSYVLLLTKTSIGTTNLNQTYSNSPQGSGTNFFAQGAMVLGDLGTNTFNNGYTSNDIVMSVTGVAAAPEPKTAAALAALFVAALVGRRAWQRRKVEATPLAA